MARIASSGRGLFLWVDLPEGMDTMGYLILFFSQRFGLYESRYDMPVLLEEFIYVSLDIFAVLFFVYLYLNFF